MEDYEDIAPNFRNALINRTKTDVPFWALLGMEIVDVKKGWAKVRLPFAHKLKQPDGHAHGGAVFSPADASVAVALLGMIDRGDTLLTVEMKINYIKPFRDGEIIAEARIVHKGKRTALGDVEVRDAGGDLVAKCLATYMIVPKSG